MKCMCAQTRPRFILSSERVLGGMEFEPMLTPREKSPLPENFPRGGSNPRHCGQRAQTLPTSYSGRKQIKSVMCYTRCLIHTVVSLLPWLLLDLGEYGMKHDPQWLTAAWLNYCNLWSGRITFLTTGHGYQRATFSRHFEHNYSRHFSKCTQWKDRDNFMCIDNAV